MKYCHSWIWRDGRSIRAFSWFFYQGIFLAIGPWCRKLRCFVSFQSTSAKSVVSHIKYLQMNQVCLLLYQQSYLRGWQSDPLQISCVAHIRKVHRDCRNKLFQRRGVLLSQGARRIPMTLLHLWVWPIVASCNQSTSHANACWRCLTPPPRRHIRFSKSHARVPTFLSWKGTKGATRFLGKAHSLDRGQRLVFNIPTCIL